MKRSDELRQRAERYQRLKRRITDPATVKAICELAAEFEMTAADLERRHHIRERAHEIWINGCLEGHDVVNWLAAERELAENELQNRRLWRQA